MHFNVQDKTIYYVRHGSHAYGLNTPQSDEDFKGVCVKPKECYFGFTKKFEQHEHMGSKSDGVDEVIYSIDKFFALASESNPNIIEVLFVDDSDVLRIDEHGEQIRSIRHSFLSKRARHSFSGYAHAQLHRIKSHRAWLLDPPKEHPKRSDFGLSETSMITRSDLGAFDALEKEGNVADLSSSVLTLFTREKQYRAAKQRYDQYVNWVKTRNPARAELEKKSGFDTKHAGHLLRLMRMCKEILTLQDVIVKRPDREELLAVRNGERSYESVVEEAERLDKECDELYKTSALRHEPDRNMLDGVLIDITERYLRSHG